jgi:hypothetical protein
MSWNTNRFIRGTLEHCGSATVAELAQAGQLAESTIRAHLREMGASVRADRSVSPPSWSLAERCAVCGEPADGQCAACDRHLCENHRRTTSVPGDSFCMPGDGCSPRPCE